MSLVADRGSLLDPGDALGPASKSSILEQCMAFVSLGLLNFLHLVDWEKQNKY